MLAMPASRPLRKMKAPGGFRNLADLSDHEKGLQ
jgi:hypothetical protein